MKRCLQSLKNCTVDFQGPGTSSEINLKSTATSMIASDSACLVASEMVDDTLWVKIKDISLKSSDKAIIEGLQLTDLYINSAQRLIQFQYPKMNGFKLSLLQGKPLKGPTTRFFTSMVIIGLMYQHVVAKKEKVF